MTESEHYSKESATILTGLFISFNYFLPLIGGVMIDRLVSSKQLYCIGSFLSFFGCLLLAKNIHLFVALALFLMSSLVTNVCLNMFITRLYAAHEIIERRVAFIWNYVGMNVGFLAGYFLTGYSTIFKNYSNLFMLIAILMMMSLLFTSTLIKEHSAQFKQKQRTIMTLLIMICLTVIITIVFQHAEYVQKGITCISFIVLSTLIYYGFRKSSLQYRNNFLKFVIYSILAIAFWSIYMLTPIAIMQLIENDVERNVFGITLAPQWLVIIDSIIILTFGPLFALVMNQGKNTKAKIYSVLNYFQLAFLFSALAFVSLYFGFAHLTAYDKIQIWPMLTYLILLTAGEIFVSPIGNSLIGELIEQPIRGLMTGAWSMNIGIGGLLASIISNRYLLPYISKNGLETYNTIKLKVILLEIGSIWFFIAILLYLASKYLSNRKINYNPVEIGSRGLS